MINYRYYKISKTKKIRYINKFQRNAPYIVFLHGFMSDLQGEKPKEFLSFAKKNKISFLALEYSGHGKSSGKFINGNITKWSNETSMLIKKIIKKNHFMIIVRSSSGHVWMHLRSFQDQVLHNKQDTAAFMFSLCSIQSQTGYM